MPKTKTKKGQKHAHKKFVSSVLAALAFTIVVGSQLGSVQDSSQLAAALMCADGTAPVDNVCSDGSQPMEQQAPPPDGGTPPPPPPEDGATQQVYCPDGSSHPSPYTCPTTTSGASSYVTQPTCNGAAYFWGYNTNRCYNTVSDRDAAEGGSATGSQTGTTCASGQWWDGNACKTTTTSDYPAGTCSNGTVYQAGTGTPPCGTSTSDDQMSPAEKQASCVEAKGAWDSVGNYCKMPQYSGDQDGTTQPGTMVGGDPMQYKTYDKCKAANSAFYWNDSRGCYYDNNGYGTQTQPYGDIPGTQTDATCKTSGGTWKTSGSQGWCDWSDMPGTIMPSTTMPFPSPFATQCAQGEYYDFRTQACAKAMSFNSHFENQDYSKFKTDNFECEEWDKLCQMRKNSGKGFMLGGEGDQEFGWEQNTECLDKNSARREKSGIERDVQEIQKQFKQIDLSQAGNSPVLAEAKAQLDALMALDLNDPCAISKAMEARSEFFNEGGLMQQIGGFKVFGDFKREIEKVKKEIEKEKTYIKDAKALALLTKAAAKADELYNNPPLNPEAPWELWDSMSPECQRSGGSQGGFVGGSQGGFGGGSQGGFVGGCSIEDLQKGDTPRGLLDAARMIDQQNRTKHFEGGGQCTDAAEGIKMFQQTILPTLSAEVAAQVAPLMTEGLALTAKCETATDKSVIRQKLEKIGKKVEAILSAAGVKMPEFGDEDEGFDLDFGGQGDLLGDLEARLNALLEEKFAELTAKFEAKLQDALSDALSRVAVFLDEKIASIVTAFGRDVADSLTTATEILSETAPEIAESLTKTVALDLDVVSEEGQEVAAERSKNKAEILQYLAVVEQFSSEAGDVVKDLQQIIASEQIPVADLAVVQEAVSNALILGQNGEDPTEDLEAIRDYLKTALEDEGAQTTALIKEHTWEFFDVPADIKIWYTAEVVAANAAGVAQGTEVTVDGVTARNFYPSGTLNVAESITMIAKTADLSTNVTVSAEVAALLPAGAEWAEPYVQAVVNEVGLETVKEVFEEEGGAGAAISRENAAVLSVAVIESVIGAPIAITQDQIEHYADFSKVVEGGQEAVHAFAVMNALGAITGANGGELANPLNDSNRAEFAKILRTVNKNLDEYKNAGEMTLYTPKGKVMGSYSAEDGFKKIDSSSITGPQT